ncbi:Uncharacterized protein TCAP_04638 [Tolypocladium capitatum]|uniref:Pyridoxamine 5'-phosphate oxidase Alr4036 family FMN-binding domain-containing protein n=1 Tax=Tolypocladium capitatum TaxID=45235 RepID=A0A2K3QD11_9HYPO|nr:Uncharacterized protein TCAP_04638 [Tolypocladium capitatum]
MAAENEDCVISAFPELPRPAASQSGKVDDFQVQLRRHPSAARQRGSTSPPSTAASRLPPQTPRTPMRRVLEHLHRTMRIPMPADAPWRATFLSHVQQMDSPTFVLSTLHASDPSSASAPRFVPRARTVVFRGMWASLPVNPKNPAPLNPDTYQTHLPTITTDARMDKAPELLETASAPDGPQSGGGGPVEGVFWAAEAKTQWRLRGRAYVIGPDIDSPVAAPVRAALAPYMRRRTGAAAGAGGSWSWSRELTAHFGNLRPLMRGTFRNPPPGTPLSQRPGQGLGLGQTVDDVEDEVSRRNFRVVVMVPEEVDRVDLSDPERGRRWNYTFVGTDNEGEWTVAELWP